MLFYFRHHGVVKFFPVHFLRVVFIYLHGLLQDFMYSLLVDHRCEYYWNVCERSGLGKYVFLEVLHGHGILLYEVPLVDHYHATLAVFLDEVEDVQVLGLDAFRCIDHEYADI